MNYSVPVTAEEFVGKSNGMCFYKEVELSKVGHFVQLQLVRL